MNKNAYSQCVVKPRVQAQSECCVLKERRVTSQVHRRKCLLSVLASPLGSCITGPLSSCLCALWAWKVLCRAWRAGDREQKVLLWEAAANSHQPGLFQAPWSWICTSSPISPLSCGSCLFTPSPPIIGVCYGPVGGGWSFQLWSREGTVTVVSSITLNWTLFILELNIPTAKPIWSQC